MRKICRLQICDIFRVHQPIKLQIFCVLMIIDNIDAGNEGKKEYLYFLPNVAINEPFLGLTELTNNSYR